MTPEPKQPSTYKELTEWKKLAIILLIPLWLLIVATEIGTIVFGCEPIFLQPKRGRCR